VRYFNENPLEGRRYPRLGNLCHYPMRGPEQAIKKLRSRADIARGNSNWHYNKMQRDPTVAEIPAEKLARLPVDPRTPGSWELVETRFPWSAVYAR
jgi:hypothetical protein